MAAILPAPRMSDGFVAYDPVQPALDGTVALDFDLPSDAVSFVLTADPKRTPRRIDLLDLRGPSDALLFDANAKPPQPFDPGVSSSVNDALPFSVMFPSSPETPFATGHYRARLVVAAAADGMDPSLAIDVVWKRAAPAPTTGRLELALYFAKGAMLDAASAQTDVTLQPALAVATDVYKSLGIDATIVAYDDFDAGKLTDVHDESEFAQLFQALQAARTEGTAVPLVFVDTLEAAPGEAVRGKASGLPGPPLLPGTALRPSGVVLALATFPATSRLAGELIAHETGHLLGLRHTSEYDGLRHDPIADTKECPADRATRVLSDGTHVLTAEDCADLDGANLMFYTPSQRGTAQHDVTAGQAFVVVRNPLVR